MRELVVAKSSQSGAISDLLAALGARFAVVPIEAVTIHKNDNASTLLLSEAQLVELLKTTPTETGAAHNALSGYENVLIYPFRGTSAGLTALQRLAGGTISASAFGKETNYVVAGNRRMCGPFVGLQIHGVQSDKDVGLRIEGSVVKSESIVAGEAGVLFARFSFPDLNLFVISSEAVFDVNAEHLVNLNVRKSFSGLVPLLCFLRHSSIALPVTPLRWAHWIIDDPNLRPRYGFLDLKGFVRSVREAGAAASIAFIPWNHRRTSREIVDLFKSNWPQLSICFHGCDHTGSEFSTRTATEATPLIDLAFKRMKRLEADSSLGCERIMVFPQGRFSAEAMRALRESAMIAAVNTELLDCRTDHGVKGGDLLQPAITAYGGFPLFMRRPAEEASENFALDLFLGKPCLIVTHHQYFERGLDAFRSKVEALNALEPGLTWTNLERGILSTYSVSTGPEGRPYVRLYSARTTVVPGTAEPLVVAKAETDPRAVRVYVDGAERASTTTDGELRFVVSSAAQSPITIEARVAPGPKRSPQQSPKYRLKVTARRYLTEARDNYLCRFPRLNAGAASMKRLLLKS